MVAADNWKSLDLVSCLSAYVTITFVALCAWVYFFCSVAEVTLGACEVPKEAEAARTAVFLSSGSGIVSGKSLGSLEPRPPVCITVLVHFVWT